MAFIITFVVFCLVFLCMALGVIFANKSLTGSCGGLASIGIKKRCDCIDSCTAPVRLYQIQEPQNKS